MRAIGLLPLFLAPLFLAAGARAAPLYNIADLGILGGFTAEALGWSANGSGRGHNIIRQHARH